MTFLLPTATSADERARAARTAVLPVGSFEQHGEYLPLITDTVVACLVAGRIAADYHGLLLPPITISCSHEHAGFVGTVSISARTLRAFAGSKEPTPVARLHQGPDATGYTGEVSLN